jgi:hypothetical protein
MRLVIVRSWVRAPPPARHHPPSAHQPNGCCQSRSREGGQRPTAILAHAGPGASTMRAPSTSPRRPSSHQRSRDLHGLAAPPNDNGRSGTPQEVARTRADARAGIEQEAASSRRRTARATSTWRLLSPPTLCRPMPSAGRGRGTASARPGCPPSARQRCPPPRRAQRDRRQGRARAQRRGSGAACSGARFSQGQ